MKSGKVKSTYSEESELSMKVSNQENENNSNIILNDNLSQNEKKMLRYYDLIKADRSGLEENKLHMRFNNGMEESLISNCRNEKNNFGLLDDMNLTNKKPRQLLNELYSQINKNSSHNHQNESDVHKRINDLKMNIFFDNPSRNNNSNSNTIQKDFTNKENVYNMLKTNTVEKKNITNNIKSKINDMMKCNFNYDASPIIDKARLSEDKKIASNRLENKERINSKKHEIFEILKAPKMTETIDTRKNQKNRKLLDKMNEMKESTIVAKMNSLHNCSSEPKFEAVTQELNKSHIKKVSILSNKFENMFHINEYDRKKVAHQSKDRFNRLSNAFNGIV